MAGAGRDALIQGLCDAAGFVGGALAGWWLGRSLGFDFVASKAYDGPAMLGLVFILLGCGAGRWLARRLAARALHKE
jgi:hypothetical protein